MSKILILKVKEKGAKNGNEYRNKVPLGNPSLLAMVFADLQNMFDAPMKKACKTFLDEDKSFPF